MTRDELEATLAENIERRAIIEQHLLNVATGKAPPLTAQCCRILALRLGTPKKMWPDAVKNYKFTGGETLQ